MKRHLRNRWPDKPLGAYSHARGIERKKKRSVLRIIIPVGLVLNGAILAAGLQIQKQFDAAATAHKPVAEQVSRVEKIPEPSSPRVLADERYTPVSQSNDSALQAVLDDWSATHGGKDWSVVVKGLGDDDRTAKLREKSWYVPASLYKLYLMQTLMQNNTTESLDKKTIRVNNESRNTLQCVDAMIRNSDNPCGEAIANSLGWWRVDSNLRKAGLKETSLNRKDAQFTNAKDMAEYLQRLYEGKLMSSDSRQWLLGVMQQQRFRQGIPAGCKGCVVADKTGDLTNVRHDAAIIKHDGGVYVLVIMTSGASYQQIAELTSKIHAVMQQKQ